MKIVILGGGTAGWLAAFFINKVKPEHSVTVVDSSKIGIIGAGEGVTGYMTDILSNHIWNFGCDHNDFIKKTGATLKYGIKHINWTGDGSYYFAPIEGSVTETYVPDYTFCYQFLKDKNKLYEISDTGLLWSNKTTNFVKSSKQFSFYNHALHFDATKVGQYFKEKCLADGIVHIDSEVLDVVLSQNGDIESLKLASGNNLEGDFFIDASGFNRVLSKKLGVKWVSHNDYLFLDSALPFILQYEEGEQIDPCAVAWAQSSGWMWQVPQMNRKGCGYNFNSNFITPEQAQQEIETTLGKKIQPIRHIKYDAGRLENTLNRNCLSIGLSAAFAEPLEATSVHSTIVQISKFVFEVLKSDVKLMNVDSVRNQYNFYINRMFEDFKDFLNIHYMGGREDSEFWKHIKFSNSKTPFVEHILDLVKYRIPSHNDFNAYYGSAGWGIWSYILAGTNNFYEDVAREEMRLQYNGISFYEFAETKIKNLKREALNKIANNYSHQEFVDYITNEYTLHS